MNSQLSLILYFTVARIGIQVLNLQSVFYLGDKGPVPLSNYGLAYAFSLALLLICIGSISPIIQRLSTYIPSDDRGGYLSCVLSACITGMIFSVASILVFTSIAYLLPHVNAGIFPNSTSLDTFVILNFGIPLLVTFCVLMFFLESMGLWKPVVVSIALSILIHERLLAQFEDADPETIAVISVAIRFVLLLLLVIYVLIRRSELFRGNGPSAGALISDIRFMLKNGATLLVGGIAISFSYALLTKVADLSGTRVLASWTILQSIMATSHMAYLGISRMACIHMSLLFVNREFKSLVGYHWKVIVLSTFFSILVLALLSLLVADDDFHVRIQDSLDMSVILLCSLVVLDGVAYIASESIKAIRSYFYSALLSVGPIALLVFLMFHLSPTSLDLMAIGLSLALLLQVVCSVSVFFLLLSRDR